ncbi:hypothetical protein RHGRI_021474 [Rhododendron griersonianum]|uniref:Protein kinase domain-containing protein n=1 Tax=Rhododendron griersonianum TaxID=479676 RepID=A0AAV6JKC1_9ERIC|nr:hypothetical protein RHGRI_021474 [Rhododendron griersonianum]
MIFDKPNSNAPASLVANKAKSPVKEKNVKHARTKPPKVKKQCPVVKSTTTKRGKDDNSTQTVIIIVVSTIGSVIGFIVCVCIFLRKRKQKKNPKQKVEVFEAEDQIGIMGSLQYDFETISIATDNFSDGNKLGQGGFGAVYQAWDLWRGGNALDIVDPFLRDQESFSAPQVLQWFYY